jgi:hypothetical protein
LLLAHIAQAVLVASDLRIGRDDLANIGHGLTVPKSKKRVTELLDVPQMIALQRKSAATSQKTFTAAETREQKGRLVGGQCKNGAIEGCRA